MKKIVFLLLTVLFLMACTKETKETIIIVEVEPDPVQQDPDDTDGDSVKNIIEEIDNTDPEDPCSYLESRLKFNATTEVWRNLDCDGDGVTNGDEVDPDGNNSNESNGTNPRDGCDLIISQQTVPPSQEWSNIDCDGDGVTNSQEIIDTTNPFDNCDLIIANQNINPTTIWLNLDCDADCVSNGQELEENTDPLNGDSYFGSGVTFLEFTNGFSKTFKFDQDGTRITGILNDTGVEISTFVYTNDNLSSAQVIANNQTIDYSFQYQGNQLSTISKTINGNTIISDLEYVGNEIIVHDTEEPPGLYRARLILNTANSVVSEEHLGIYDGEWIQTLNVFSYDTNGQLTYVGTSYSGYDPVTETFYDISVSNAGSNFDYAQGVNNPFQEAAEKLKIQAFLEPELFYSFRLSDDAMYALFEPTHLEYFSWATKGVSYSYTQIIECTNDQNNPTRGRTLGKYGDLVGHLTYIYE